jgi:hypothetical protein
MIAHGEEPDQAEAELGKCTTKNPDFLMKVGIFYELVN